MLEFPSAPVAPAVLLEKYLPEAFGTEPLATDGLTLDLGVRLDGSEGGEWVVSLEDGRVRVRAGSRAGTPMTLVQSVEDWRGALWEGRGAGIGRVVATLFRPDADLAQAAATRVAPKAAGWLRSLEGLRGLLGAEVTGQGAHWRVAVLLGPGEVPAAPTTTVSLAARDADRLLAREIGPMEAFLSGRIRVSGDMSILLKAQAARMEADEGEAGG